MIEIYFRSIGRISTKKSLLRQAAMITIQTASPGDNQDCTILVSNDNYIRNLNRRFRDVDAPTDVLSFSSENEDDNSSDHYLGDVIISYPTALRQAGEAGHPVDHEMCLLVVHGILHLMGYDHQDLVQKKLMWSVQKLVLKSLDIDLKVFSGDSNNDQSKRNTKLH